ncbi:MAG TPA: rubrerythrin family protein [Terracidiphilus sp.]|jgi:rubrerythrin
MVAAENENGISNLLEAYENEVNAHAQYKAFATKAEAEGMYGAASLFRAAARAEQIHASNHARVIRHMGGGIEAEIRPFRVRSTMENLKAALGGEQQEIESLYPSILVHAASQLDTAGMRSIHWAIESEKTHARLYEDALATMETGPGWTKDQLDFYVCTLCGYTAKTQEADNCPACNFVWDRFEVISLNFCGGQNCEHAIYCGHKFHVIRVTKSFPFASKPQEDFVHSWSRTG